MSVDTRVRADLPMEDIDAFRLGLANQNRISDRVKLAREIAARTEPRFIEIKPEPRRRTRASSFAEIPRQRGGGRVPCTEAELTAIRGGLWAEEYRLKFVRKFGK